jgi:hypothetical protein
MSLTITIDGLAYENHLPGTQSSFWGRRFGLAQMEVLGRNLLASFKAPLQILNKGLRPRKKRGGG